MLEDIKQRLAAIPEYKDMNPYLLWFDCKYLLSEVDYYKRINAELKAELERLEYERLDI